MYSIESVGTFLLLFHLLQTGYSSAPGIVRVESYDVFSRKHEAHVVRKSAFHP